jgi:hypothetical protein
LLPFRIGGPATAAAVSDRHAAADLGDGPVGQLHHVEVVDDQHRVGQGFADGGLEHRAHVDRDSLDLLAPGGWASGEPVDHRRAGAALDLGEQPLPAGQIDEADVPAVDGGGPRRGDLVETPARLTPANLVDAQHGHRFRFSRQHRGGMHW